MGWARAPGSPGRPRPGLSGSAARPKCGLASAWWAQGASLPAPPAPAGSSGSASRPRPASDGASASGTSRSRCFFLPWRRSFFGWPQACSPWASENPAPSVKPPSSSAPPPAGCWEPPKPPAAPASRWPGPPHDSSVLGGLTLASRNTELGERDLGDREGCDAYASAGSMVPSICSISGGTPPRSCGKGCPAICLRMRCMASTNSGHMRLPSRSWSDRSQMCASASTPTPDLSKRSLASAAVTTCT
mmetsp:Transcript_124531/g.338241  ORF Transcript_124531/g.338241 Transcript_124531/m.338241 type:complete len:246 (-) Transcript_124531:40-777(-)